MSGMVTLGERRFSGRISMLMSCLLAYIAAGFITATLGPSLPSLAGLLGLSLADAGLLRALRQAGNLLAQLPSGWLLDRIGSRAVLIIGAFLVASGLMVMVAAPGLGAVFAASLLLGLGTGCLEVTPNVAVGVLFTGSAASAILAGLHAFYGAGSSAGPAMLGVVGWRGAYLVGAALCIGVVCLTGAAGLPRRASSAGEGSIHWRKLIPLGAFVLLYNGLELAVGDWLYIHLTLGAGADDSMAITTVALFWLLLTAGRLIAVPGLQRFGRDVVLAAAIGMAVIGMVIISLPRMPVTLVVIGSGLVAFGFAPIYPISVSLALTDQAGAEGKAIGILGALAAIGSMVVPVLQGWVGAGHDGGMLVSLVGVVLLALIGAFWVRIWRKGIWQQA